MQPNLFLVGAAKSGTTALARMLAEHPRVFLPQIKEPSWWSSDYARGQSTARLVEQADYDQLYAPADAADHDYALDASTSYLMSDVAIPAIAAWAPEAKFIVVLRDPTEMAQAFHMESVFNTIEDQEDFETAWRLQEARARGEHLPPRCPEPRKLQYRHVCSIGTQLERLSAQVPAEQLLILFQDDMLKRPDETWTRIFAFLGLAPHDFDATRKIAGAHFQRFPALARLYTQPPPALAPLVRGGKRLFASLGATDLLKRALSKSGKRAPLSPEMKRELRETFAEEVRKLERITGRDLSAWRPEDGTGARTEAAPGTAPRAGAA